MSTTQRIVTVGRAGSKCANVRVSPRLTLSFPLWQIKVYETFTNKKGVLKWKLVERIGTTRASYQPSQKLLNEAKSYASTCSLPFDAFIVQYKKVKYA